MKHDPFEPGLLKRLPEPPRKVALVRASRIGDFVSATPAFRALAAALPGAEVTMITLPQVRDSVERLPFLHRFVAFPGYPGIAEQFFDARRATNFFQQMQAEQFDLAVQMQGSGVNSNPFTLMLGAQATAGYVRSGDGAGLLDAALSLPLEGYEVDRVLAMTRFLGAPDQGRETVFALTPGDHQAAGDLTAEMRRPLIGLHPGARASNRLWPLDRFAELGARLRRRYGGDILIVGGPDEQQTAQSLVADIGPGAINLAGMLSLAALGAVLTRLAVFVTNDSGSAHIAYALHIPTVTIFGGGDPARNGPPMPGPYRVVATDCACRADDRPDCVASSPCLQRIGVDRVMEAAREVMGRGSSLSNEV